MRSEALIVDSTMDGVGVNPNLLEGTNFGKPMSFSMFSGSASSTGVDMYPFVEVGYEWNLRSKSLTLQPGTYTLSCLAKSAIATPSQPRFSSGALFGNKYFDLITNAKWVPLEFTFSLSETKTGLLYLLAENSRGRVKFSQIKLEVGDVRTSYAPHQNDLIPTLQWVGTSLKINELPPVNLQGATGTFSPEQSHMLEVHEATLSEHGVSISELKQKFGKLEPSILINSDTEYLSAIAAIEQAAQAKSGSVCSTIRLTNSGLPIILPCPELLMDREITITRVHDPLQACAMWSRAFYIHTNKSSSQVGIVTPGSMPFTNFVYRSSLPSFPGCKGYELSSSVTGSNKFRAISDIDCSQSLSLTFRAIGTSRGVRWLLMDASVFDARISVSEMGIVWGAVSQVRGAEPWTAKMNGIVVPRTYITSNSFTVTDKMSWITWAGTSGRNGMQVPPGLPSGFEFRVQNNSQYSLSVTASFAGGIRSIPRRSIYAARMDNGYLLLYPLLANIDSSTGQ